MTSASDTPLSDDYVAKVLTRDAQSLSTGISKRSALAPKPNIRFLKNVIREADGHNANLKRKEEREARDRRPELERSGRHNGHHASRNGGLLTPQLHNPASADHERSSKRRRIGGDERGRRDRHRDKDNEHRHPSRSRSRDAQRAYRSRRGEEGEDEKRQRKHGRETRLRGARSRSPDSLGHHHRHRRRSESSTQASLKQSGRTVSHIPSNHSSDRRNHVQSPPRTKAPVTPDSDSDPLDALIGPLPPEQAADSTPAIRGRGRGTLTQNTMDRHFKSNYDPSVDTDPESEGERDDWEGALEAVRDRQKWKQVGAQRLREAGFGDEEVKRWEKGKAPTAGGEGDIEDVRWNKQGQDREWDKGKVVNGVGNVAGWGRLKDTSASS